MSQNGVDVQINFARELQNASAAIQATPEQLSKAGQRAIKKTMRWVQTRISREISSALGISQKVLKSRFSLKTVGDNGDRVTVFWIGVAPIAAERTGSARQTRAGVSVKKNRYQAAFYKDVYGHGDKVWIRQSRAKKLGMKLPKLDTGSGTAGDSTFLDYGGENDSSQRGRFPIVRVAEEVAPIATDVFKRFQNRIPAQFSKILAQELNYVVNHERS